MAKTGAKVIDFPEREKDEALLWAEDMKKAWTLWHESKGKVIYLPFARREPRRYKAFMKVANSKDLERVIRMAQ